MKTFSRTFLPEEIKYNGSAYKINIDLTHEYRNKNVSPPKGNVIVLVLSRNLRGKTDLHGHPYQPTKWIFSKVKTL